MVGEIIENSAVTRHKKGGTVLDKKVTSLLNGKCVVLIGELVTEFHNSKNLYANLLALATGRGKHGTGESFELMIASYDKLVDKFKHLLKAYEQEIPELDDIEELKMYEDLRSTATTHEKGMLVSLSALSKCASIEMDFVSLALSQSAISIVIKHIDKVM